MPELKIHQTRIHAGIWEGVATGAVDKPDIRVLHLGKGQQGVVVTPVPGRPEDYAVRFPIPVELLSEGVQTFLLRHDGKTVGQFSIVTGVPIEQDIRAEIDLLRAELDVLKRAFRTQFRK